MRSDRSTAALATIAIHAGIAVVMMMPVVRPSPTLPRALSVFDVSASAAMSDPKPPKVPQPEPVTPKVPEPVIVPPPVVPLPTPNQTIVAMLEQAEMSAQGGACDLTEPVQAALRESEAVAVSLPQIPQARRSVANAIMIWNAQWVELHQSLDPAAMAAIRDTVARTIAAASPECRLQPQSGPRLILLPGLNETTVLALGSGIWRWQDLVDTARPQLAAAAAAATVEPIIQRGVLDGASIALR